MSQTAVHFEGGPSPDLTVEVDAQNERIAAFLLDLYKTGCDPAPIAREADFIHGEDGSEDEFIPGSVHAPAELTIPEDVSVERLTAILGRIGSISYTQHPNYNSAA